VGTGLGYSWGSEIALKLDLVLGNSKLCYLYRSLG
jgi:hypothetical protein